MSLIINLEAEWEAYDIISYCKTNNIICNVMQSCELDKIDNIDFMQSVPFCNTTIVQKNLMANKLEIIDTYSPIFNELYGRDIKKMSFGELVWHNEFPYFLKLVGNSKEIDGTIIESAHDLNILLNNIPELDSKSFYVSNVVSFNAEYRLFIGNSTLYGMRRQKGFYKEHINKDSKDFITQIINKSNNIYCIVDIGFNYGTDEWQIVEVNPPFSVDDYGLDINIYMIYCINAWINLTKIEK